MYLLKSSFPDIYCKLKEGTDLSSSRGWPLPSTTTLTLGRHSINTYSLINKHVNQESEIVTWFGGTTENLYL